MENKNPLSPHIQIYNWHVSSLVSISHRITGIINILAITLICLWISSLFLGETNYKYTSLFLNSFFGKFLIVGIIWSFSFQITGFLVIFGSFGLTVFIYLLGRNLI
jgi:succinate dehydrogenase / fumarate reductase cytochrome b subunit